MKNSPSSYEESQRLGTSYEELFILHLKSPTSYEELFIPSYEEDDPFIWRKS